ncbi:hypothetical protein C8Q75DRAFT_742655 [Abortiporus biennis]|nr:hypothetical protein C8Q75DRAFT_742655 [Abortiporus biennis]
MSYRTFMHLFKNSSRQMFMLIVNEMRYDASEKLLQVRDAIYQTFGEYNTNFLLFQPTDYGVTISLVSPNESDAVGMISDTGEIEWEGTKRRLQEVWPNIKYIIVDYYPAVGKSFLGQLSKLAAIGKGHTNDPGSAQDPFRGINVLLIGNPRLYTVFPEEREQESLIKPTSPTDNPLQKLGRELYERFTAVTIIRRFGEPIH